MLKRKRGRMVRAGVTEDEAFGRRLKEAMTAVGLRPGELAKRCGVHPVTVARWRRGEVPDDLRFPQLAQCLGIAEEWLKTGQGAMIPGGVASGSSPPTSGRSGALRPLRAADQAQEEIFLEAQQKLLGRGMIPAEEAVGWLYRMLRAREVSPPPEPPSGGPSSPEAHG